MASSSLFSAALVERLQRADHVTAFTGAGVSAESGIPTFRDPDGLWQKFKPEELANIHAFLDNPALVQAWYAQRRATTDSCEPNPAHRALANLEAHVRSFTLVTQNVDDLHNRAGSRNVIELHGNLRRSYCIDCERPIAGDPVAEDAQATGAGTSEDGTAGDGDGSSVPGDDEQILHCPACGGLIRPDVVWFGEMLPEGAMEAAYSAAREADVFLSIGTSAVVYPAADLPIAAAEGGAYTAEINIERSAVASYVDEVVLGKAGDILPALVEAAF